MTALRIFLEIILWAALILALTSIVVDLLVAVRHLWKETR
jgi:hypothetical protein